MDTTLAKRQYALKRLFHFALTTVAAGNAHDPTNLAYVLLEDDAFDASDLVWVSPQSVVDQLLEAPYSALEPNLREHFLLLAERGFPFQKSTEVHAFMVLLDPNNTDNNDQGNEFNDYIPTSRRARGEEQIRRHARLLVNLGVCMFALQTPPVVPMSARKGPIYHGSPIQYTDAVMPYSVWDEWREDTHRDHSWAFRRAARLLVLLHWTANDNNVLFALPMDVLWELFALIRC